MQVNDALEPLGRSLGLHFKTVVGGTSMDKQIYALRRGVDVLVATPGRIADLIRQGECFLDEVEVVVLDEADQMCDMGFLPEVTALLELCSPAAQTLLFSATLDGDVDTIVREHMHDPIRHELDAETSPVDTMEHHVLVVNREDKAVVATEIARRDGRTIMFVRSQLGAERVAGNIADRGVNARALHGGMSQHARTRTMAEFKEGKIDVLVATDVAARGIHVDDISARRPRRPAGGPQGLPAPRRPHRPRRCHRSRCHPGAAQPAQEHAASARQGRRERRHRLPRPPATPRRPD